MNKQRNLRYFTEILSSAPAKRPKRKLVKRISNMIEPCDTPRNPWSYSWFCLGRSEDLKAMVP